MIKFVMCITRHPDMTREEFKDYWMNKHGPFFVSNADAMGAKYLIRIPVHFTLWPNKAGFPEMAPRFP